MKIVQIDGVKGVITAVFMGACLFQGLYCVQDMLQCHCGTNIW